MSNSQTLSSEKNNPSRDRNTDATSQEDQYNYTLIHFVYREVIAALDKRKKGELKKLDLDSLEVLIKAQRKADEQFRRGMI